MSPKLFQTVLIIDDSPDDLEYYRRLLARKNASREYSVLTATNSRQGLRLFETHDVDCSLVDYNLPDQSGTATVRAFQEWARIETLPVIMLTGEPSQKMKAEAARAGALDYLVKNAINSREKLERAINKAIGWSKCLQE